MSQVLGTTTISNTSGNITVTLGMQPTWMKVTVGGKSGGDSYYHLSDGTVSGSVQKVVSTNSTSTTDVINGKVISLKNASGTVIFEASFVAFTSTGVTFNVTTPTSDLYPALIWAGN